MYHLFSEGDNSLTNSLANKPQVIWLALLIVQSINR